jgi:hypothetical protein
MPRPAPATIASDREARALIVAAEAAGFRRERGLPFWEYDESLHVDAACARAFLESNDPQAVGRCASAPDPIPAWLAVRRIVDERGGINCEQVTGLIEAASERGFDLPKSDLPLLEANIRWEQAEHAIAALWDHDPQALSDILGDQGTIAPLPESAITRCPSCCDDGWVPHPHAGRLPSDEPDEPPF